MNPYFPHLFSPMKVKNVTYRNRIFSAPSALKDLSDHDHITVKNIDYLRRKAQGGAAVVTLGEGYVHPTGVVDWSYKLKVYDIRSEAGLYDLTGAIQQYGAVANLELNHAGMHFHDDNRINYGPSDRLDEFDQGDGQGKRVHQIHEMPKEIIEEVVDSFGKAALRAKHCGFGQVMVHAAHGWLLAQFLSPVINQRKDEFGGSLENRARITMMVLDSIRRYCGRDFPIEVRISWQEGLTEGYQLEDTIEFCKMLEAHDADMIHVSSGSLHYPETTPYSFPSWFDVKEGKNIKEAAEIKKHLHIPVGCVGAITDPVMMEKWIAKGMVDYVVLCRAQIADPDLPQKAMQGRLDEIRPCLRCIGCLTGGYYHLPMHCAVNPVIGRDSDFLNPAPPAEKKRVLIAGGGPAGMEAAIVAAGRGHEVILCEKQNRLGGLLPIIDQEPFKIRIKRYCEYLERRVARSKIDVRLNTEVTPELVAALRPDKLIAAVGASPVKLPLPGIDKAINIVDFYRREPEVGKIIAVLGGGFAGVECAIGLAMQGKKTIVVEMGDELASGPNTPYPGTGAMQIDALWFHVKKNGVQVMLNTKCMEITDSGMVCEDKDGKRFEVKADTVISATGLAPNEKIVDLLRDTVIDFSWIGDCYAPGLIRTAVRQGFDAAMSI
jgi:2,4-dienoyl-CoA reductase-like NADH-dependent reductase (Old Yellow Enzyme family)/thioredoxin reductase